MAMSSPSWPGCTDHILTPLPDRRFNPFQAAFGTGFPSQVEPSLPGTRKHSAAGVELVSVNV